MSVSVKGQPWLESQATRAVMRALEAAGGAGCARFVGGCVRNSLLGQPVDDIDIATRLRPEQTMAALKAAGLKAVPTGVEHGTVTGVSERRPYEITTLRRDVETDGRRAVVAFTEDWAEDAARRAQRGAGDPAAAAQMLAGGVIILAASLLTGERLTAMPTPSPTKAGSVIGSPISSQHLPSLFLVTQSSIGSMSPTSMSRRPLAMSRLASSCVG